MKLFLLLIYSLLIEIEYYIFALKSAALTSYLQFSTVAYLLFGKRSYRISDNRVGSIVNQIVYLLRK